MPSYAHTDISSTIPTDIPSTAPYYSPTVVDYIRTSVALSFGYSSIVVIGSFILGIACSSIYIKTFEIKII
jgi:hypothetical protein